MGAIQNRKLRREVTTISRMLHKNIVRYYQAWVEGGKMDTQVEEAEADAEDTTDIQIGPQEEESSGDDSNPGWWTNSPIEDGIHQHLVSRGDVESDENPEGTSDSTSWGDSIEDDTGDVAEDEIVNMSNPYEMPPRGDSHSASIDDLLNNDHDFQVKMASLRT